jgi:hypothetical protein
MARTAREKQPPEVVVEIREKAAIAPKEEALGDARSIFLETLALKVPELLEALRREVLPIFQTIPASVMSETQDGPETSTSFDVLWKPVRLPNVLLWRNLARYADVKEVVAMKEALRGWAERCDLHADWFLDSALLTLHAWCDPSTNDTDEDGRLVFASIAEVIHRKKLPAVDYKHDNLGPNEAWDDYEERQVKAFKAHLDAHQKALLDSGYMWEPDIENHDHFVWVALAYGKRQRFEDICELQIKAKSHLQKAGNPSRKDVGWDAIRKAVHSKARLLGLPRLKTTMGRPKKSEDEKSETD